MTGRKVTRRASMRRKSMRSPSVTRSNGSKTPRSFMSEPHASGKDSFNSSAEKLDDSQLNSLANNSGERLSKAVMSSSELLADELAAVKINDSKENMVSEVKTEEDKVDQVVPVEQIEPVEPVVVVLNESKASLYSKGSIADLAKNRSNASINATKSDALLSHASSAHDLAKKSTDELVAVLLDSTEKSEEPFKQEESEVKESESAPIIVAAAAAATESSNGASTENPAEVQTESTEETKKSCLAQKIAKCRCVIS